MHSGGTVPFFQLLFGDESAGEAFFLEVYMDARELKSLISEAETTENTEELLEIILHYDMGGDRDSLTQRQHEIVCEIEHILGYLHIKRVTQNG